MAKKCKITTRRTGNNNVVMVARAGANGTGREISRATGWDNARALDQMLDNVLFEVKRQGYEPTPWDASGDE